MAETGSAVLRTAQATDAQNLAELKLICFRETFLEDFAVPYPPGDLARFEAQCYGVSTVAAELADPAHATWVYEADERLLAYAHAGPCKLPHPAVTPLSGELYQIYVRRDHQGSGYGKALLSHALDWLAVTYPGPVWLGVWSGNHRAQAIYADIGFQQVGGYNFMVGDHCDAEFILRRD